MKSYYPFIYINKISLLSDIVRGIIISFLTFFVFCEIRKKFWKAFLDLNLIMNIIMIVNFLICIYFKIMNSTKTLDELLENPEKFDFNRLADGYRLIYIYESIFFSLVSIKILVFLKLNKNFGMIYSTIESAVLIFLKYSLFYFIFLIGYSIFFYILYGPYIIEFSNLKSSIVQILLFTVGKYYNKILYISILNPFLALFCYLIVYLFIN